MKLLGLSLDLGSRTAAHLKLDVGFEINDRWTLGQSKSSNEFALDPCVQAKPFLASIFDCHNCDTTYLSFMHCILSVILGLCLISLTLTEFAQHGRFASSTEQTLFASTQNHPLNPAVADCTTHPLSPITLSNPPSLPSVIRSPPPTSPSPKISLALLSNASTIIPATFGAAT